MVEIRATPGVRATGTFKDFGSWVVADTFPALQAALAQGKTPETLAMKSAA